jgi:MATE family multidrug resistance protein
MLRLAVPVVTVQVGLMAMGVVDTLMVGRVSAEALAAVALGNVYFFAVAIFGVGVLLALDPVVAQAVGAGDELGVTRGLQRGIVLAVLLAVPASLLLLPVDPLLRVLHQPAEVVPAAAGYAMVQVTAVLPFYLFVSLRQTLQAMHRTAPIVTIILLANLANVGLNWAFIFGHLGLPAMGAVGSSWATAISRWLMAVGLLAAGWAHLRPHLRPWRPEAFHWPPLMRMLVIGAPIGAQHQLEFGIFGVVGLMMGSIGAVAMAGHQVALNLASFTFMVPMGVAGAAAVLVGNAVGRGDLLEARRAAGAGLVIGLTFMAVSAGTMIGVPDLFARAYTNRSDVAAVAVSLIPLAGVFQVFDGLQVVSIGILRGLADTRAPMVINVVGFWLVGLPISAWLGLRTGLGPRGLWWGLVVGLAAVALILLARVRARLAGQVRRVAIDHVSS